MQDVKNIKNGVSIVIPTKNSGNTLEYLLKSIYSSELQNIEVIIVDSNSTDKTKEICFKYDCRLIESSYGRSKSRNLGAQYASYRNLLFLDSDMEVTTAVLSASINCYEYDALIFKEITIGKNLIAKIRQYERIGLFGTVYPEAPRCIKKNIFTNLSGYNESMEGFEDLDLHSRLMKKDFNIQWDNAIIYHHEDDISFIKYLKKRRFYSLYLTSFKNMNPDYYAKLTSLKVRLKGLYNSAKSSNIIYSIILIPMVISLRLFEILYSRFEKL